MHVTDSPFPGASKPQALPPAEQPPVFDKSFNVSLSHNAAMTLINETIEKFVRAEKVRALGFGIFQVNDRELAELNNAIKQAFLKFTL